MRKLLISILLISILLLSGCSSIPASTIKPVKTTISTTTTSITPVVITFTDLNSVSYIPDNTTNEVNNSGTLSQFVIVTSTETTSLITGYPIITTTTKTSSLTTSQSSTINELSLVIVSVTSPVSAGSNATLKANTVPNARCSIDVYYKSGKSTAAGLISKIADSNGNVSWTWKVGTRTTPGSWKIIVIAQYNSQSVSKTTYFTVT